MFSLLTDIIFTATRRTRVDRTAARKTAYADHSMPGRIRKERRYDSKWDSKNELW